MNFRRRPELVTDDQAHDCSDPRRIAGWTRKMDTQSGPPGGIAIELGFGTVLSHGQINSSIAIEIAHRRSALFAVHAYPALSAGKRPKAASPIASQHQAQSPVMSRRVWHSGEEILSQENILGSIAIEIGDADPKRRGELRFDW